MYSRWVVDEILKGLLGEGEQALYPVCTSWCRGGMETGDREVWLESEYRAGVYSALPMVYGSTVAEAAAPQPPI
jgi:hypothetical protein